MSVEDVLSAIRQRCGVGEYPWPGKEDAAGWREGAYRISEGRLNGSALQGSPSSAVKEHLNPGVALAGVTKCRAPVLLVLGNGSGARGVLDVPCCVPSPAYPGICAS